MPALSGWEFSLDLDLGKRRVAAYRSVDSPSRMEIEGDTDGWAVEERRGERLVMHVNEWTRILGEEISACHSRMGSTHPRSGR